MEQARAHFNHFERPICLLVTGVSDPNAEDLSRRLTEKGARVFLFSEREAFHGRHNVIISDTSSECKLVCAEMIDGAPSAIAAVRMEDVAAAHYWHGSHDVCGAIGLGPGEALYAREEARNLIDSALEIVPHERWVNRPDHVKRASKPLQIAWARRAGLKVSPTLVSNSKSTIEDWLECDRESIAKSLGDGAIFRLSPNGERSAVTTRFYTVPVGADGDLSSLADELVFPPVVLQRRVRSPREVRIAIIGDESYAIEFESQAAHGVVADIRLAKWSRISRVEPPPLVIDACIRLLEDFRLHTASFDFIVDDRDWNFLEFNPSGAWGDVDDVHHGACQEALAEEVLQRAESFR